MINVSIVLYHTPISEVSNIVKLLRASNVVDKIWLIDNSEIQTEAFIFLPADYIFNNKNLGYGTAHNIALKKSISEGAKYHLVLNSDIEFNPEILQKLENYMDKNPSVGHIMPLVRYPNGEIQYLAKLLPTPFDLASRRFLPKFIIKHRMSKYELHNIPLTKSTNVAYLSGCFMMLRCEALQKVGYFNEKYFMYPEDLDLSRRIHEQYRTEFYPLVEITHQHAQSSYHNLTMLIIHIINICKYFNQWGWFFDRKRSKINQEILKEIEKQ